MWPELSVDDPYHNDVREIEVNRLMLMPGEGWVRYSDRVLFEVAFWSNGYSVSYADWKLCPRLSIRNCTTGRVHALTVTSLVRGYHHAPGYSGVLDE